MYFISYSYPLRLVVEWMYDICCNIGLVMYVDEEQKKNIIDIIFLRGRYNEFYEILPIVQNKR